MMTEPLRILSFDPGTEMGWAVLEWTCVDGTWTSVVIAHGILDGNKLIRTRKHLYAMFSKSFIRLEAFYFAVVELIVRYRPTHVVSEGAFMYSFAAAFASLYTIINAVRKACHDTLGQDVIVYAPKKVKLVIAKTGKAGKEEMKKAVLNHPLIKFVTQPEDLTEHEVDAIAHGTTFLLYGMKELDPKYKDTQPTQRSAVIDSLMRHIQSNLEWLKTLDEEKN